MGNIINLTGKIFGKLTVIDENYIRTLSGAVRWNCICDCGRLTVVIGGDLKSGRTSSCGCFQKEKAKEAQTTHGMHDTPEHHAWNNMKNRCNNEKAPNYHNYGGRGITVCDRWMNSFENFYEDMGPRPSPDHSLDREEVNGNYEKDNCRWATDLEQQNNRRDNVRYEYDGSTRTVSEWGHILGIKENSIRSRLNRGWSFENAVSESIQKHRSRDKLYEIDGEVKTLTQWSESTGIPYWTLLSRINKYKWSPEKAVKTQTNKGVVTI